MKQITRLSLVDRSDADLPIVAQCRLLKVARSTLYYRSAPVSADDLRLMRRLDEQYLATPFYGSRRMVAVLRRDGEVVNRKRVRRLMRLMGIEAIYQKPNTCVSAWKKGSDSMLMHSEWIFGSESKGNRCHGQRNHSHAVRTDNRTYRTRAGRACHHRPANIRHRGMSNLRPALEQHPQPLSTFFVGPAVTGKAGPDQRSGSPLPLFFDGLPAAHFR
jgi:putative transposase